MDEVFRLRRVTSCLQRQEVTKKRRPGVCAQQLVTFASSPCHPWRGIAHSPTPGPALHGRAFGPYGVTLSHSIWASPLRFSAEVGVLDRPSLACLKRLRHPCLARVCARLFHLVLRGSAQPDGGNVQSHIKSNARLSTVIPAQAGIQSIEPHTPQLPLTLRPLPQGERGLKAGSRRLLTLLWLWLLPCCGRSPRLAAPSIGVRGEQARAQTRGEAGCRRFHPQAMDGLWVKPAAGEKRRAPSNRFLIGRRRLRGGPSLVTFLWLLTRK